MRIKNFPPWLGPLLAFVIFIVVPIAGIIQHHTYRIEKPPPLPAPGFVLQPDASPSRKINPVNLVLLYTFQLETRDEFARLMGDTGDTLYYWYVFVSENENEIASKILVRNKRTWEVIYEFRLATMMTKIDSEKILDPTHSFNEVIFDAIREDSHKAARALCRFFKPEIFV